jgi:N-acetylglucosamine-6-phosphate deacetylase
VITIQSKKAISAFERLFASVTIAPEAQGLVLYKSKLMKDDVVAVLKHIVDDMADHLV